MKNLLNNIRKELLHIVDDIDAGNSDISGEEAIAIAESLRKYTRKDFPMSKYQAYTYLNISRATFDNMVKGGILPSGRKVAGFKELFWYKRDLDKAIKKTHGTK